MSFFLDLHRVVITGESLLAHSSSTPVLEVRSLTQAGELGTTLLSDGPSCFSAPQTQGLASLSSPCELALSCLPFSGKTFTQKWLSSS